MPFFGFVRSFQKNLFSSVETVAGVESRALGFRYMCMYNFFGSSFFQVNNLVDQWMMCRDRRAHKHK